MPNFNSDVVIEEHDLILADADGNVLAHLDQAGNLVVRQEISGAVTEILRFLGGSADLHVGTATRPGTVRVEGAAGETVVMRGNDATILAGAGGEAGDLVLEDAAFPAAGASASVDIGTAGNSGELVVHDGSGRDVFTVTAANAALYVGANGNEGDVIVRDSGGRDVIHANGSNAALYVGAEGNEGDVVVRDGAGRAAIHADANVAWLRVGVDGNEGDIEVQDGEGRRVFHLNGSNAALYVGANGNEGDVIVRDGSGTDRIHLDGNSGDIKLMGADLAEDFDGVGPIEPGSVLVAVGPDLVAPASQPLDRRVVGVASGAGSHQPALRLASRPGYPRVPVALVGRVYCRVDASPHSIAPGDLLTTSAIPGVAVRAPDGEGSSGAIFGKALARLENGEGLIPVLLMLG